MQKDTPHLFGIYCSIHWWPSLWRTWYLAQAAAIGWKQPKREHLAGFRRAYNVLSRAKRGDYLVVILPGKRIARLGEIVGHALDEWDPLVRVGGEDMGRRVNVRWVMEGAPVDPDTVVQMNDYLEKVLPFNGSAKEFDAKLLDPIRENIRQKSLWVRLGGKFNVEKALSDYISAFPHSLEDGLVCHPDKAIREHRFADGTRSDVILLDANDNTVIVECKQGPATIAALEQLTRYGESFFQEFGIKTRLILVHGGSQKLNPEVARTAKKENIEVVSHAVTIDFKRSH